MGLTSHITESSLRGNQKQFLITLLFFICLLLVLLTRVLVFFGINIAFIDSDQPFMWIGAADYAQLRFYEPRFYGQDYNTFMEGLFAVPLIWLGVPVYYAVPIATHVLFLFPFIFSAIYLFWQERKEHAVLVLSILLCLPSGFDILSSLPRGFVSGLFFSSFFVVSFLNPSSFRFMILNTMMSVIAYFVNPNSLIISFPFAMFLFLHHYRQKNYYYAMFACASLALPLHLLFNQFYLSHPEYVVFELVYSFSPSYVLENLRHLNQAFQHVNFFVEDQAWCVLALMLLLFYLGLLRNRTLLFTVLSLFTIILLSFFSGKVRDGSSWPFYSYSRMYLGLPLLLGLLCTQLKIQRMVVVSMALLSIGYSSVKLIRLDKKIEYHTQREHWLGVHLVSLNEVKSAAALYSAACKQQGVDRLIISNGFWLSTYLNYGGPAMDPLFPNTEETNAERRYYVREPNKNKVFERFLYISTDYQLHKKLGNREDLQLRPLDDYGLYLVSKNRLPNHIFMKLTRAAESL